MFSRISSSYSLRRLRTHLQRGGLIAYPTESCYGIGALPTHAQALRQILRVKKRPQHKGLIVIGDDVSRLQTLLFRLPEPILQTLNDIYPAPKTFILPARKNILPQLRGRGRDKLAVRVPDHEIARRLCRVVQSPLVSTSCNRSGGRPCRNEREVRRQFGRRIWVIGGRVGKRRQPSEIIDWSSQIRLR
ncbi:L-threonylcarbamoyladenylate synthase [Wielerella bovis]|uniref:L-threonylcarbamoyladenylate synthase n=1 Tax=Wielerella bovis TaxID=2917790 RepID=UPI00201A004A|nr:L-threonylcarbamoyladenylate synthase [Wielerella bovis]ULJ60448.1 L-threonylcarbamoyladenylate synthase [Wielerella bovis]